MTQRVSAQPAWILHRRAYRDSSLILDLLTRDYGCISVVARAGRKSKSSSLLQVFQPLAVDFFRRGELGTLGYYESLGRAVNLQGQRLWCGFYVNELSLRLLPKDEVVADILTLYEKAIRALQADEPACVLRHYEYGLLQHAGFALDPLGDADGEPVSAQLNYQWNSHHGLVRGHQGVPGQAILNLISGDWNADVRASRALLTAMIEPLLGSRPLQTADMLRELAALRMHNR